MSVSMDELLALLNKLDMRVRVRRRNAAQWTSVNEVLLDSEIGLETDTGRIKIGNGTAAWNSLPYVERGLQLGALSDVNTTGRADSQLVAWNAASGKHVYVAPLSGGGSGSGGSSFTLGTTTFTIGGNVWTLATSPVTLAGDSEFDFSMLFRRTTASFNFGLGLIRSDGLQAILVVCQSNCDVTVYSMTTALGAASSAGGYGYSNTAPPTGMQYAQLRVLIDSADGLATVIGQYNAAVSSPRRYSSISLLAGTWYPAVCTNIGGSAGAFVKGGYQANGAFSQLQTQTVVHLPLDGTNGQTTITDTTGRVWTRSGTGAAISTAQSVSGGASLLFSDSGANSNFNTPGGALVQTDTFTMQGWVYTLGAGFGTDGHALVSQPANTTSGEQCLYVNNADKLSLNLKAGNSGGPQVSSTTTMSRNAWHHVLVTFDPGLSSNQWKVYQDGVLVLQQTWSLGWVNTGQVMSLGQSLVPAYPAYRFALNGYMDMWRIKKGVVEYTSNFTPPTPPLGL